MRHERRSGPFTPFPNGVGVGNIDFCVPMITATVCDPAGSVSRRLNVTVSNSCGKALTDFKVVKVQQNSDLNFPNEGTTVFTSVPGVVVGSGVSIDLAQRCGQPVLDLLHDRQRCSTSAGCGS